MSFQPVQFSIFRNKIPSKYYYKEVTGGFYRKPPEALILSPVNQAESSEARNKTT